MTEISVAESEDSQSTSSRDSLCYCDAIYRRVLLFVCSMYHIPPYLFLSQQDDDDVRDIGKCDFRSVLLHPMLSNAIPFHSEHLEFSLLVFRIILEGNLR